MTKKNPGDIRQEVYGVLWAAIRKRIRTMGQNMCDAVLLHLYSTVRLLNNNNKNFLLN